MRAGGLSAQPHSRSSSEAIINSPSSNINTGSDNASLDASNSDVIMDSYIETSAAESESEIGGSSEPEIRLDDALDQPLFDMPVPVDGPAFSEFESNTDSGNSTDSEAERAHWTGAIASINISDICDLSEPESNTGTGSGNSTDSEAERAHWTGAIASINISDICDLSESDQPDDSELDDLEEVGQMKKGLVDEDIDVDSDCISDISSDFSDRCASEPSYEASEFNYMSKADPWTNEELLSFLLYDIKQTENVNRRAYERFGKVCFPFSSL